MGVVVHYAKLTMVLSGQLHLVYMGVESQLGQGATFWIELQLPITEVRLVVDEAQRQVEEVDLQGIRVLVVDDEAVNYRLASEYLQQAGCEVQIANDGQ